ncbi:MAG: glycosyltransferase [Elusimicrobiota bacterium]
MLLSFVVMTVDRENLLRRCLDSLANLPANVEVLVVFNGSTDDMRERIGNDYPWARPVPLPRCSVGQGRNRGAAAASGSIIYFLDDDTIAPKGFAARVLDAFNRFPRTPCIGGPNLATADSGPFQRASDFLLRSPLGAGPMRVRYQPGGADRIVPGWALMLCNLGVRREVFDGHGLRFPERCVSAEENLLMSLVEKHVGPVMLSPGLYVYHERRAKPVELWKQVMRCGRGRAHITKIDPTSLKAATLAAPLWLAYLVALPWLSRGAAGAAPLILYVCSVAWETGRLLVTERSPAAALLYPMLVPMCHVAYALGFIDGFIRPHE